MTGEIDDERAMLTSERWEDCGPKEAAGKTTVYQQKRRPSAKLQRLGLALRPAHAADACVGRVACE